MAKALDEKLFGKKYFKQFTKYVDLIKIFLHLCFQIRLSDLEIHQTCITFYNLQIRQKSLQILKITVLSAFFHLVYTVNPRISPRGLLSILKIIQGRGLSRGRGLIEKVSTLHGGLFKTAFFLHAIIISGLAIYINYNK